MWRLIVIGLLLAGWHAPVIAQCAQRPFPTSVVFVPSNPAPGQSVVALLSPITSETYAGLPPTRTGNTIDVVGPLFLFPGVPPPPAPVSITLGAFPAGTYLVRFRLTDELPSACAPLDANLVVGGGAPTAFSVPTFGAGAAIALAALLMWLGWQRRARS